MEAKEKISSFLSKDGKHMTIVDQDIRNHITEEHHRPHHHEIITTAIDKEVHQDHHQTRIQPIIVRETACVFLEAALFSMPSEVCTGY